MTKRSCAWGVDRTIAAIRTGVRAASLYNTMSHGHAQTRAAVDEMAAAGADVRALGSPFPRMIIIDHKHLFIDNMVLPDTSTDSGWHVTDPGTVAWAVAVFNCYWKRGTSWQDLDRLTRGAVTTARQR